MIQKNGSGRVALGGVAHKPWPVEAAEAAEAELPHGARPTTERLLVGANPTAEKAFKVKLAERTLAAVLAKGRGPEPGSSTPPPPPIPSAR